MYFYRPLFFRLWVLSSLLTVCEVHAIEYNSNFLVGTSYSDNSLLVERNKKSELAINALVGFDVIEMLPDLNYTVNATVRHINYTKDTLADTTYYTLAADLVWDIVPTSFSWQVNNNLSVRNINEVNRPLPNNLQQVNIFSTGPSFVYRVSPINNILFDYRYYDVKYEKKINIANVDSKRDLYSLAFDHRISERSNVSLNLEETTVEYLDVTTNSDFTGNSIFLSYDSIKASSTINLSAGVSKAILKENSKVVESNFYSAMWDYQINFSSNFSARYWNGLSDPTNDVRLANFLNSGVINTAVLSDTSIFSVERLYFLYNQTKAKWKTIFLLYGFKQDYDGAQPSQSTFGGSVTLDYNLTRSFVLMNQLSQVSRKLLSANELNNLDSSLLIGFRYYLSTNLQLVSAYRRNERDSNRIGRSYEENVISINLTYANGNLRGRLQ